MMRGLVALRRAPLHRCVRSLRGRATRVEASGPDAVATVNARLGERTGRTSVPAIWIGGEHVGGLNDGDPGLVPLDIAGGLDAKLRAAGAL